MKTIAGWMLLRVHKNNLCKPFHYKKEMKFRLVTRRKGWCPVLAKVYFMWDLQEREAV